MAATRDFDGLVGRMAMWLTQRGRAPVFWHGKPRARLGEGGRKWCCKSGWWRESSLLPTRV
ncbi:MAG: hypothetical protein ACKN9U_10085, partial [Pirellulaceae bacterium]